MARTTVNIETPILSEIKQLQKREGKSLGQVISQLLAEALSHRKRSTDVSREFRWHSQPMGARIDLADKEMVWSLLDHSTDEP